MLILRYLTATYSERMLFTSWVFRSCPGNHFADAALFIYIASALHTFNISPPQDENGRPIHIEPRGTNGMISSVISLRVPPFSVFELTPCVFTQETRGL